MIVKIAMRIFSDMQGFKPKLSFMNQAVTVIKTYLAFPHGFYFRAEQYHTRFIFIINEEFMVSGTVFNFWVTGRHRIDRFLFFLNLSNNILNNSFHYY